MRTPLTWSLPFACPLCVLADHCHAPTCLHVSTTNHDTGELLWFAVFASSLKGPSNRSGTAHLPSPGFHRRRLDSRTEPVYGGTHGYVADQPRFDEPGYSDIP